MPSNEVSRASCPVCGTTIAPDAPFGQCPRCILALGRGPLPTLNAGEELLHSGQVRQFGDYELIEELARGGMGVVYRARQISLGREVALKMILAGELATAESVQRFRNEAMAAARLDHPNIVPVYEIGEHETQPYFSMRLVTGGQNIAVWAGALSLPSADRPARIVAMLVKVARAVAFAHAHGVLHRDLKPSNILVDDKDEPQVVDFGVARRIGVDTELTLTGQMVGTPRYMAPEQVRGGQRSLTAAADTYSLGAILYELLSGRKIFAATDMLTLLRQVAGSPPAPLALADPALERIILRCLQKSPSARYGSATEFADALEGWLRREPETSLTSRLATWARRRPGYAILAAVGAVSAFIGAAGLTRIEFDVKGITTIPVENSSFESPDLGHDTVERERFTTETPKSWVAATNNHDDAAVGVLDPYVRMYRGSDLPALPGTADGAQTGYFNLRAGSSNVLTYSGSSLGRFTPGDTYTLTVALGGRRDNGLPASWIGLTLLANGAPAGPGTGAPAVAGVFFDVSYSFTATAAEAGKDIGIQISARNDTREFQQANFDNVRLVRTGSRLGARALREGSNRLDLSTTSQPRATF